MAVERGETQDSEAGPSPIARPTGVDSAETLGFIAGIAPFFNTTPTARDAIAANLTAEHITEMLRQSGQGLEKEYSDRKIGRFVWAGLVVFAVLALIAIIIILAMLEMPDLLREIMFALAGLVGGFGAGYGYRSSRR